MISAIEVDGLSFTYRDAPKRALSEVGLRVEQGEFLALLGPSGSGKSTLCLALNGLIPRTIKGQRQGTVRIRGREVTTMTVAEVAREIGIVFQDFDAQLFATSVAQEIAFGPENLCLPREQLVRRVDTYLRLMRLVGLHQREPATLSGGQRQRLAVAAALALEADILVLDEPTSDLDQDSSSEVLSAARQVAGRTRTLIVVERDTEVVTEADRVALMREGSIVATGKGQDVLTDVELLVRCGIRPPQLSDLFHRLRIPEIPLRVAEAVDLLDGRRAVRALDDRRPAGADRRPVLVEGINLSHVYAGSGDAAIRNVNVAIRQGEFLALIGRNGSGKTTLAKLLCGLLRPTEGEVRVTGRPVTALSRMELAQQAGYVFQNPDHQLFSATAHQEVGFGLRNFGLERDVVDKRVTEALRAVGLEAHADKDPFTLTKGERQRLAIASVLAMHPALLVLDEVTTGLDYWQCSVTLDLLVRLNRAGHTIVVVTHSPAVVAEYASQVLVMNAGRVALQGTPREVFRREDVLADAGVRPPPVVQLSNRLNAGALTVEDLTGILA